MKLFLPLFAFLALLWATPAWSALSPVEMSRKAIDQLMNLEKAEAAHTLKELEKAYPDYPLLSFAKATLFWAQAEASYDEDRRDALWEQTLNALIKNIVLSEKMLKAGERWKLSLGMSQSFAGLVHMRMGNYMDAITYAKLGRNTLRELIHTNPGIEDAYFVLGFYEFYTGSVPFYLSWLTAMFGLSGDRVLGLKYIYRAIQNAPLTSPEAARLLLVAHDPEDEDACEHRLVAEQMHRNYPRNEFFGWYVAHIKRTCRSL